MGRAYGVETDFLQLLYPADLGIVQGYGSEQPVVMVDAAALELHGPAVDLKASHGIGRNGTDTEETLVLVACRSFGRDPPGRKDAVVLDSGRKPVEVGGVDIP